MFQIAHASAGTFTCSYLYPKIAKKISASLNDKTILAYPTLKELKYYFMTFTSN